MVAKEYTIAVQCARVLDASGLLWCHVPNEEPDAARAALNKRMGVKRGVPDILIFSRPMMAVELKSKTGRLTQDQAKWHESLEAEGVPVVVVRGVEELLAELVGHYGEAKVYGRASH